MIMNIIEQMVKIYKRLRVIYEQIAMSHQKD